jgi:WD40 repeat protein
MLEHWSAILMTLEGHWSMVIAVQFSRDGSKLASASHDGKVIVWDLNTGAQLQTLEGHSSWVNAVQFSRDGSKLASASHDGKVIVWDPNTGAQLQTLEGHSSHVDDLQFWRGVTDVQFSRDGTKLASASDDRKVIVWDPNTGAQLQTLEGHSISASAVQFSRDGSKLASASDDGKVIVWDPNTGALLQMLKGHSNAVSAVQFSRDGSKLASASFLGKVIVWDPNTGALLQALEGHWRRVNAVQFSRDGSKLASASDDGEVIMWDLNTGALLPMLEGHWDRFNDMQFSRDGSKLASAYENGTKLMWDLNTGALLQTLDTEAFVSDMAISANGSFLRTNVGSLDLQIAPSSPSGRYAWSPHLQVQGSLWHDHKTIWSPPEYLLSRRADAAHEPIVASSRSSGAVYAVDDDDQHGRDEKRTLVDSSVGYSMSISSHEDTHTSNLQIEEEWICRHDHKIIWLPPELRPCRQRATAIRGSIMVFGHSSGKVSFWKISD